MMRNHHAVLVRQGLFQERNTITMQSIILNVIKLRNLIDILNFVSGVGHITPERGPDKTISLIDFITLVQEGHVLKLFKILIHMRVCLVHRIVVVFVIPRNDKGLREVLTDKLHECVVMGLTRIANVSRQDTDITRWDLTKKRVDVFDELQM